MLYIMIVFLYTMFMYHDCVSLNIFIHYVLSLHYVIFICCVIHYNYVFYNVFVYRDCVPLNILYIYKFIG
jgi:hypothetical protein